MMFFTVLLLLILSGVEIDLYVPTFNELQTVFNLSPFWVELTLTVNLVTHCIASFFVGNLGDRLGRKPVILYGLIVFILGTLLCMAAPNYWVLLLGRAIQGIGIAGPKVLSFLVIADNFSLEEQQSKMGLMNGLETLAMALAPMIGSYINLYTNWRGNFGALLVLGVVCFILAIFFIPKSEKKHDIKLSLKEYIPILSSRRVICHLCMICLLIQSYWVFIALSPILYMKDMNVSLENFGFYQGAMAAVFGVLSILSGILLRNFGQKNCIKGGFFLLGIFIVGSFFLIIFNIQNPLIITLILLFLASGLVFPVNIVYPVALEAVPASKGRISALIVAFKYIFTASTIQIVTLFYDGTFLFIGLAMSTSIVLGLGFFWYLIRLDRNVEKIFKA